MRAVRFADECSKWKTPAQTFSSSGALFWARTQTRFAARTCVEIKVLRRVRAESSRRPPRHRRDACSGRIVVHPSH